MTIDELHEPSNERLWNRLPPDQIDRVLSTYMCDIGPEFLGFIGIYERLAEIIPIHWTVVDLGCAYAPQALLFDAHKEYVGVDLLTPDKARFSAPNSRFFEMPIAEFIEKHVGDFNQDKTFAICSYVPPWHGNNREIARQAFQNVFTFYPH